MEGRVVLCYKSWYQSVDPSFCTFLCLSDTPPPPPPPVAQSHPAAPISRQRIEHNKPGTPSCKRLAGINSRGNVRKRSRAVFVRCENRCGVGSMERETEKLMRCRIVVSLSTSLSEGKRGGWRDGIEYSLGIGLRCRYLWGDLYGLCSRTF